MMAHARLASAAIPRELARPPYFLQPLGRPVDALLINASFLDVFDFAAPFLEDVGLHVITGEELNALHLDDQMEKLASVEVIFGPGPRIQDAIRHAPNLKIISLASSGYESIDLETATKRGIAVTNAPTDVGTESVADLTFGLILDVARQISRSNRNLCEGMWQRPMGATVWNKTLGIIGLGRIGSAVATRARGFGMRVLASRGEMAQPRCASLGVECVALEELLRESDFVSIHCRSSPRTHHLIGREELSIMKESAYLINTARPDIIDQEALLDALRNLQIAGAGLDVYEREPRTDDPIISLPNVVVTPHIGNRTREGVQSVVMQSIHNAMSVLHNREPANLLNPAVYQRGE